MSETEYLAFIDPIKHKIFRLSKRFLVSVDEAEDATQDVLLKLWKNRKRLSSISNPEAFAMTITKNHCFDRLKSRQASNLKIIHSNFTGYESLERRIENNDSINLESLKEIRNWISRCFLNLLFGCSCLSSWSGAGCKTG